MTGKGQLAPEPRSVPATPAAGAIAGVVDSVVRGAMTGWVFADAEAEAREVLVRCNGEEIVRVRADHAVPGEAGRRQFHLRLPSALVVERAAVLEVTCDGVALRARPGCLTPATADAADPWTSVPLRLALQDVDAEGSAAPTVGHGGWLFADPPAAFDPWSADDVADAVAHVELWSQAFRHAGIVYVLAVVPARERLAARRLPAGVEAPGPGPLRQLRRALRAVDGVDLLDLAPVLIDARADHDVVLRTGSGLSPYGAFAAARALMKEAAKVAPAIRPLPARHFVAAPEAAYRGDLAGRLAAGADPELLGETAPLPAPGAFRALQVPLPSHLSQMTGPTHTFAREDAADLPRAALLGSGVDDLLARWVAESFRELIVNRRDEPEFEQLEIEMPDTVIHVLHEAELRTALVGTVDRAARSARRRELRRQRRRAERTRTG